MPYRIMSVKWEHTPRWHDADFFGLHADKIHSLIENLLIFKQEISENSIRYQNIRICS